MRYLSASKFMSQSQGVDSRTIQVGMMFKGMESILISLANPVASHGEYARTLVQHGHPAFSDRAPELFKFYRLRLINSANTSSLVVITLELA